MKNDLSALPWKSGQLHSVENYWEAVGVMTALRGGLTPESVRRPLKYTSTEVRRKDADAERDLAGGRTPAR